MQWDLFLFDFDGLLVNTEPLHYQAYVNALAKKGYPCPLSFAQFFELAHLNSDAWQRGLCALLPELDWKALYQEKKAAYAELVVSGKVEPMPGVIPLLEALQAADKRRVVVTHSSLEHTQLIRSQLPILKTLPHWITREDYDLPKPHPECYQKAIALYGKKGDRIIGFEDSVRGLRALQGTPALAVLICPKHHPLLNIALDGGALHFESLEAFTRINDKNDIMM